MTPAEETFIAKTIASVKALMLLYGTLQELDTLWAGSPNYDGTIDQAAIDSVPTLNGALTLQQLSDAEFALAAIKNTITGTLPAMSVIDVLPA